MDHEDLLSMVPSIELFEKRLEENITNDLNRKARTTLEVRKWNAPKRLPMTDDIRKLHLYLEKQGDIIGYS